MVQTPLSLVKTDERPLRLPLTLLTRLREAARISKPSADSRDSKLVLMVAGEASADLYGAKLVKAMGGLDPGIIFWGIGGERMQQAGVKILFSWGEKENKLLSDPGRSLKLPPKEESLPKNPLTQKQLEALLSLPDLHQLTGLRNRAILELFYATAMRVGEMASLTIHDPDYERKVLWIRQGKGKKDRLVPLSERAIQ